MATSTLRRGVTAATPLGIALALLFTATSHANASSIPCSVHNVRTGATTASLGSALGTAEPSDTLDIRGTCPGNFTVTVPVTLQGDGPDVTLDGNGTGTVLTIDVPSGTVTVNALKITGGSAAQGGGIAADAGGSSALTLDMLNDRVTGDSASFAGAGMDAGKIAGLNITKCAFTDDTISGSGGAEGAAIVSNGTADIYDSNIIGNSAAAASGTPVLGGALYLTGPTTLNVDYVNRTSVTGGEVTGGGVYATAPLSVIASQVAKNTITATSGAITGGGLDATGPTVAIEQTNIGSNVAKTTAGAIVGAGIDVAPSTALTFTHASVSQNRATSTSGSITGVGVAGGADVLTQTGLAGNAGSSVTGAVQGGAIAPGTSLAISSGPVTANSVRSTSGPAQGGAVYSTVDAALKGVLLTGNSASTSGGGVFLLRAPLSLAGSEVVGNSAPSGAAIVNSGGTVSATRSLISGSCSGCA